MEKYVEIQSNGPYQADNSASEVVKRLVRTILYNWNCKFITDDFEETFCCHNQIYKYLILRKLSFSYLIVTKIIKIYKQLLPILLYYYRFLSNWLMYISGLKPIFLKRQEKRNERSRISFPSISKFVKNFQLIRDASFNPPLDYSDLCNTCIFNCFHAKRKKTTVVLYSPSDD